MKRKDWREVSDEEFYSAKAIRQAGIQPWPADRVFDQVWMLQDDFFPSSSLGPTPGLQPCAVHRRRVRLPPTLRAGSNGGDGEERARPSGRGTSEVSPCRSSSMRRWRNRRQSRTSLPRWTLRSPRRRSCACSTLSFSSSSLASDNNLNL